MTLRVIIVDDEELVRSGLRVLLEQDGDLTVVGVGAHGGEAVELARTRSPDVVLMDIRMPFVDGVTATRSILERDPQIAVVVLTTFGTDEHVLRALRAGARGFLLKNSSAETLRDAVRRAARGEAVLDPAVTAAVVAAAVGGDPPASPPVDVTARELEVLRLLARGRSNAEIATALVIEVATVKTHVARLLTKLGARDRTQAAVAAYELGLVRAAGDWP